MGRISRIGKAILNEIYLGKTKTVYIEKPNKDDRFSNDLAFISGGSSGIGYEIAKQLLAGGAKVIITARSESKIANAISNLNNDNAKGIVLDVRDISSFFETIDNAASLFPTINGINMFINSAGVFASSSFIDTTEKQYDEIIEVNLKGMYFLCQAAAKHMINRNIEGHILNISSSSALRNAKSPYEISKWGVKGLTLGAAEELIPYGIVVNAIAPGPTATPMLGIDSADSLTNHLNPSKRYALPSEIASLALCLLKGSGDLVVGDTIYATGGAGTICIDR